MSVTKGRRKSRSNAMSESLPIENFDDLINWSADKWPNIDGLIADLDEHHQFAGVKIILCHDMKGGYLEDRFIDGHDNHRAYCFFHWSLIDTFIYFSHHFITIPPITWTNAAHSNGVPVLGTIITEGEKGIKICADLLKSCEVINFVCTKLVHLALHLKFEGWFINIENQINQSSVFKLLHFVETLRSMVKEHIPHGQVIWYDSVIMDGSLKWQNCLNQYNLAFLQCSDGIFLNYGWDDAKLKDTYGLAASLGRLNNVYVGVDVFGRGVYGGGGFNTNKAIDKIREHSLPVAIFAPGWVLEKLGPDEFIENQIQFWDTLRLKVRHVPKNIPFSTNFCLGFGLFQFKNGKKVGSIPWFNLSRVKPSIRNYFSGEIFLEDAFEGGQSINLVNWDEPILRCHFSLKFGLEIKLIFKITRVTDYPEIKIKATIKVIGLRETACSDDIEELETLIPINQRCPIGDASSNWNCLFYQLKPSDDRVLTSIKIAKIDLTKESKLLIGGLEINKPHQ